MNVWTFVNDDARKLQLQVEDNDDDDERVEKGMRLKQHPQGQAEGEPGSLLQRKGAGDMAAMEGPAAAGAQQGQASTALTVQPSGFRPLAWQDS